MSEQEKLENEATDKAAKQLQLEELLIEQGVMIPANDLVHYITRNNSYMKLINSEEFKNSDIDLETILTDEFITEQFDIGKRTAETMRYVTEKVIPQMQEVKEEE